MVIFGGVKLALLNSIPQRMCNKCKSILLFSEAACIELICLLAFCSECHHLASLTCLWKPGSFSPRFSFSVYCNLRRLNLWILNFIFVDTHIWIACEIIVAATVVITCMKKSWGKYASIFVSSYGLVATNKETCCHPNSKVNLDCSLGNYSYVFG